MRKSSQHTPKSQAEREYYSKALKHLDYQPTVDDTIKFPETDDANRDYSLPTSSVRRRPKLKQQILSHFEENWIKWLLAGISIIIFYLMVDSKIGISTIDTKVDIMKEDILELKGTEKENIERFHKQDLQLQETKLRVDAIEKRTEQEQPLTKKN